MVLTRWDPLFDLRRAHLLMDRRRPRFFELPTENWSDTLADHRDWVIPLDIVRSEDNVTVHATLQGVNPDDIDVTVDDGVLSIKAETEADEERKDGDYVVRERRYGKFHRSMRLPENVDADHAEPHYENGALTIKLPVAESKKAKQLKVTAGKELTEAK
mgnify:CR=1 FL=1